MKNVAPQRHLVRPGLIEGRVTDSPETFSRLGEGFKKIFIDSTAASSKASMAF